MTVGELVENIQQHFPEKTAMEITKVAKRVLKKTSARTGWGDHDHTKKATVDSFLFYTLPNGTRRVRRVDVDGESLNRLTDIPAGYDYATVAAAGGGGLG